MNMLAPHTSLYAGLLGLMVLFLAFRIVRLRRSQKVGLGDGGDQQIQHAMRVMGNFVEYTPIALILIGLLELNGTPAWMIHLFGATLLLARLAHLQGFGSSFGVTRGRYLGTLGTWLVILFSGLANLVHYAIWAL